MARNGKIDSGIAKVVRDLARGISQISLDIDRIEAALDSPNPPKIKQKKEVFVDEHIRKSGKSN